MPTPLRNSAVVTTLPALTAQTCLVAVLCLSLPLSVLAHRDRGPGDPCRREVGVSLLHITLYQTQFDPVSEYCEEVPRVGTAFLVVDVTPDLWERPMAVELAASDETGALRVIQSLPLQVYERGVANTEVVLQAGRQYEVRVALGLEGGAELRNFTFPFQVAAWYKAFITPALLILGLVGVLVISIVRYNMAGRNGRAVAE